MAGVIGTDSKARQEHCEPSLGDRVMNNEYEWCLLRVTSILSSSPFLPSARVLYCIHGRKFMCASCW